MTISILTLFPEMFHACLDFSIIKRAQDKKLLTINLVNIRNFATGSYKAVDDHPYGGGTGMIMRADVLGKALQTVKGKKILLDPQGTLYTQKKARQLSLLEHLVLVCGHYEGVDQRVRTLVDEELSIGDFIVSGGEIPALVIVDSIVRLIPGVLAKKNATQEESFTQPLLEYPQYTRPSTYKGMTVPEVLLSGDHARIAQWRQQEAKKKTLIRRPDLLRRKGIRFNWPADKGRGKLGGHR